MGDLFHVARFNPEEEEEGEKENIVVQKQILEKLQNKISKKRKHEESAGPNNSAAKVEGKEGVGDGGGQHGEEEEEEAGGKRRKRSKKKKKQQEVAGEGPTGFTVLGDNTDSKRIKVTRVLPHWLANPDIAEVDLLSEEVSVDDMEGLDEQLREKLKKKGIKHFFPVQRQIIPILTGAKQNPFLRPRDICVSAPTGSGKTLAFVLPILQSLRSRVVPMVRALVVLPTQDLALQVYKVFNTFTEGSGLKVKLLTGLQSVAQEQAELFRVGCTGEVHQLVDILVVTPGRLTHHIRETPHLLLTSLRYLVIDEADRMMANISDNWLNFLEAAVYRGPRERPGALTVANARKCQLPLQKLLFSATLSQDPEKLEQLNLFEPKLFRCIVPVKDLQGKVDIQSEDGIGEFSVPSELTQLTVKCEPGLKPLLVSSIINKNNFKSLLVFTKSNESTHRLAILLSHLGHSTGELSSEVKEKRKKVLGRLRTGAIQVLVCSDALARGIDVENLEAVISYDSPQFVKTYIHRIGRTARAGHSGTAVTLLEPSQVKPFRKIIADAGLPPVADMADLSSSDSPSEIPSVGEADLEARQPEFTAALEATKRQLQMERTEAAAGTRSSESGGKKSAKRR